MEGVTRALLLLLAGLPVLEANDVIDKDSPFYYDWEGLQLGGMICAGLMCIAGLLFALSGKCKCKNKQKHGSLPEKAVPLLTPEGSSLLPSISVCVSPSVVSESATPWTVAQKAPLPVEFSSSGIPG